MSYDEAMALAAELAATPVHVLGIEPWIYWPGKWLIKVHHAGLHPSVPYGWVYSPEDSLNHVRLAKKAGRQS